MIKNSILSLNSKVSAPHLHNRPHPPLRSRFHVGGSPRCRHHRTPAEFCIMFELSCVAQRSLSNMNRQKTWEREIINPPKHVYCSVVAVIVVDAAVDFDDVVVIVFIVVVVAVVVVAAVVVVVDVVFVVVCCFLLFLVCCGLSLFVAPFCLLLVIVLLCLECVSHQDSVTAVKALV